MPKESSLLHSQPYEQEILSLLGMELKVGSKVMTEDYCSLETSFRIRVFDVLGQGFTAKTSSFPFPCFLVLGFHRQAQEEQIILAVRLEMREN